MEIKDSDDITWQDLPKIESPFFAFHHIKDAILLDEVDKIHGLSDILFKMREFIQEAQLSEIKSDLESGWFYLVSDNPTSPQFQLIEPKEGEKQGEVKDVKIIASDVFFNKHVINRLRYPTSLYLDSKSKKEPDLDTHADSAGAKRQDRLDVPARSPAPHDQGTVAASTAGVIAKHALDIACRDADGSPACRYPYTVTLADGTTRSGKLNPQGKAHLEDLPEGSVEVAVGPEFDEGAIEETRTAIQRVLAGIIAREKEKAAKIEAELQEKGLLGKSLAYAKAYEQGGAKALWGMLKSLNEFSELISPLVHLENAAGAAWGAWKYSDDAAQWERFKQGFEDAEFKELVDVLGFDPRSITKEKLAQAMAMANFIMDDGPTHELLVTFAEDFVKAQHSLELTETGGGLAMNVAVDILITALTLGAGAALVAASRLQRFSKLIGPLIKPLKKMAELLKRKAGRKKASASTGDHVDLELGKPENGKIESPGDSTTMRAGGRAPDNQLSISASTTDNFVDASSGLSKRQAALLEKLTQPGTSTAVRKSDVSLNDLAALTEHTGNEFGMFTLGSQRTVIRGYSNDLGLSENQIFDYALSGHRFSGHTHPGITNTVLTPSAGDTNVLRLFNEMDTQRKSVILNSQGDFRVFSSNPFDDMFGF